MKTKMLILILLAGLFSVFTACGEKSKKSYQILDTPVPITDNLGNARTYRLYLPAATKEIPLLVYFHGVRSECFKKNPALKTYTGSPIEETGLIRECKLNKIALLVPEPEYEYQFLGCPAKGWSPFTKELDGIEKIIDAVVEKYTISKKEIYLAGISAGAVISHHLANRRPGFYNAVLSHSQGYIDETNHLLQPTEPGPRFGVIICYTRGDYKDLIPICVDSEKIYRESGYRTLLLPDLAPENHSWDSTHNRKFIKYLHQLGQYTHTPQPPNPDTK